MPSFSATPKPPGINKHRAAGSSQLGAVFESSSEDDLDAGKTDNCDSTLSTDSSISSVSSSDEDEDGRSSLLYSSDDTVRGRVPPNTPKKARAMPTEQAWKLDGETGDYTNEMTPSSSSSISLTRQRRISILSNELHTVLAPHTLGTLARRRSMPDGNSYHYVHNELDYHMHYHQDPHPHHPYVNEQPQQQQRVLETVPQIPSPSPSPPPLPQYHIFTYPQHNLCPTEYDRVDRWRTFANTFTPSPVRSPDCGAPICTPPRICTPPQTYDVGSPAPVSPILLLQKLRALSNDLNRAPYPTRANENTRANAHNITSGRRTAGRGRGRSVRTGNGRNHATALGASGLFEKRGKEIQRELGELVDRAAHGIEISSRSPSPSPSPSPQPSPLPDKGHTQLHVVRKKAQGGSGSTGSSYTHPFSSSRPYEDSNWVVVDGEMEMMSGMAVGFHESSMSEVDCQWDAPKPKFLQKLFQ